MNKQNKGENFSANSSPPLQKIFGKIIQCQKKKVYKKNQFCGNTYFKLQVINEAEKHIIFAYPNLVSKQIFTDIEQINYDEKEYVFFGEKMRKGSRWILHDWKLKDYD